MSPLIKTCFLLLLSLLLLGYRSFSQLPGNTRSVVQMLDSLNKLHYVRPHSLNSSASVFQQHLTTSGQKKNSFSTKKSSALPGGLRASATVCFDTAGRYFMSIDSLHLYVNTTANCSDGNILVAGEFSLNSPPYNAGGYLMKCNDTGKILWTRLYDSIGHIGYSYISFIRILELSDGSLVLASRTTNKALKSDDLMMTHIDNTGNIIWNKTYTSRLWQGFNGSGDFFWLMQMKQDPASGDIYFCGGHWENGKNVTRLSITNGSVIWSRFYDPIIDHPFGLDIRQNDLVVFSRIEAEYNSPGGIAIVRINKNTGDTLSTRYLKTIDTTAYKFYKSFLSPNDLVKLDNGNYAVCGTLYKYFRLSSEPALPFYQAGVVEIDPQFNYVSGFCIRNNTESSGYAKITVHKDGSGLFSMYAGSNTPETYAYYVQFKNGQLLKQRIRVYNPGENPSYENNSLQRGPGNEVLIKLVGIANTNQSMVELLNLHLSDTSSACLGVDDNSNFTETLAMEPTNGVIQTIGSNDFSETSGKTLGTQNIDLEHTPGCRQLSYCDTLSLVPSADSICVSAPIAVTVRKRASCGATPFMNFDTTQVQLVAKLNDSSYQFNFKKAGTTFIGASIMGCAVVSDSVKVVVLAAPGSINLGPDTSMCTGNTIRLSAKPGYKSYLWQNTFTDSFYIVTQPGKYFVAATDSCGNIYRDTIMVSQQQPPAFDLGSDINVCEKDTINIVAPASFIRYTWWPNYQINSLVQQSVKVYPLKDTMYHVKAEKTPGCFVEDSVRVIVKHAPSINLGPDSSFCQGDSLLLDAGAGFANYTWNTGWQQQKLVAHLAGSYSVIAKTNDACISKDTVRIQVFKNPVVQLGNDSVLCAGVSRLLDAGNFSSYAWNTGSGQRIITVSQPGVYAVRVTDINNCQGADTVTINTIIQPPAGFLPADTSICSYGKLTLQPAGSFSSFNWSTQAANSSLIITDAGTYWLEVKDKYGCKGRDSIVVTSKDCIYGFYIPNAFTPGTDGKNDVFRPLIFGNLQQYEFTIYNRFGQVVFKTTELRKGWDGSVAGSHALSTNVFVWVCKYKLADEPVKTNKGTVLLMR